MGKDELIAALENGGTPGNDGSTGEPGTPAPNAGTPGEGGQLSEGGEVQKYSIGGEEVTEEQIKEWKAGHMKDGDYRAKTAELARTRDRFAPWLPVIEEIEEEMRKTGARNPAEVYRKLYGQQPGKQPAEAPEFEEDWQKAAWEQNQKIAALEKANQELKEGIDTTSHQLDTDKWQRYYEGALYELCSKKEAPYPLADKEKVINALYWNPQANIESLVKESHEAVKKHDDEVIARYNKNKGNKAKVLGSGGGGTSPATQNPPALRIEDGSAGKAFAEGLAQLSAQ